MIFYTIHSYDILDDIQNNINYIKDADEDCSICLEKYIGENNDKTYKISYLITTCYNKFIKPCECEYNIHINCITEWIDRKNTCIICRKKIKPRIVLNCDEQQKGYRYFIIYISMKIVNGIVLVNTYIYLLKNIYRIFATMLIYTIFIYYLIGIIL